mgnify:CR=1 FL=1
MPFRIILLFGLFGILAGSFLGVCIHRLPRAVSVVWPFSQCPACGYRLFWFEKIPILSWGLLGRRCRSCSSLISVMYPAVEIVTGVAFAVSAFAFGDAAFLAVRLTFACALIVLFVIDLQHRVLPNIVTLPGIGLGFGASLFLAPRWLSSLLGIILGAGILLVLNALYTRLRGHQGFGMGDVKMLAMIGAFLGWPLMLLTLLLASLGGSIVGLGLIITGRRTSTAALPFGTFLATAALIVSIAGDAMLAWYLSFYR